MKKRLALIISLILTVSCILVPVLGEEEQKELPKTLNFDNLSAVSSNDLIAYDKLIETEKANRGLFVSLPIGSYLVGKDIAPGNYKIKHFCISGEEHYCMIEINVYADKEESTTISNQNCYGTGELFVSLEEGQLMKVRLDSTSSAKGLAFIEKINGLFMD